MAAPFSASISGPPALSSAFTNPTRAQKRAFTHMDRLRWASSAFMIAAIVLLVATVVFIGLAQARYLLPMHSLYPFGACLGTILVTVVLDVILRSIARKSGIDPEEYFRVRQPMPAKKKKETT